MTRTHLDEQGRPLRDDQRSCPCPATGGPHVHSWTLACLQCGTLWAPGWPDVIAGPMTFPLPPHNDLLRQAPCRAVGQLIRAELVAHILFRGD